MRQPSRHGDAPTAHRLAVVVTTAAAITAALLVGSAALAPSRPVHAAVDDLAAEVCLTEETIFGPTSHDLSDATDMLHHRLTLPGGFATVTLPSDPQWNERLVGQDNWEVRYQGLSWTDPLRREALRLAESDPTLAKEFRDRYEFLLRDFAETNHDFDSPASKKWTWYDFSTGQRATVLTCATTLLGRPTWLTTAMEQHARVLSDGSIPYKGFGNHALMMNNGLISIGCVLPRADYLEIGLTRDEALLTIAVDAQGVNDEGSVNYQLLNHMWWSQHRAKRAVCGHPAPDSWDRIDLMPRFLDDARFPDGQFAGFGDTTETRSGSPPMPSRPPLATAYSRGYVFSRSAGDRDSASMVALRFGPPLTTQSHGHVDAGSVLFYDSGVKALTDSGMYAYNGGFWRGWVKSARAHNTISVDSEAAVQTTFSRLIDFEHRDGYTKTTVLVRQIRGANWYRTVLHSLRDGWILVDDQVTPSSSGAQSTDRTVTQRWNLADGVAYAVSGTRVDQRGGGVSVVNLTGERLYLREGHRSGDQAEGWRSYSYGEIEPAPAILNRHKGTTWHTLTLIAVRPAGTPAGAVGASSVALTSQAAKATVHSPTGSTRVYLNHDTLIVR